MPRERFAWHEWGRLVLSGDMSTVLVTGGAGNLGRHVTWALLQRNHQVRVLVHQSKNTVEGAMAIEGDVVSGEGVDEAMAGVDAVVHTATKPGHHAATTEVEGTRNVVRAAEREGAHVVYASRVGADRVRQSYYDAKWEAEGIVEDLSTRWTIQRATVFHDLIDEVLGGPVFFKVPRLVFQPVDVCEVAWRLVGLVESGPVGRPIDFGGPELLGIETLARQREEVTGKRSRLIRVPCMRSLVDYAHGHHLSPEHRDGKLTWSEWLELRARGAE